MEKAEGIVLKTIDYGESNEILRVYTREFGKIGLMARGAKNTRSPLKAVSQVLTQGSFLFRKSKGLGTLYQGEVIQPYKVIKADIVQMAYAAYIIELLDKLTEENERQPYLYDLLYQSLNLMNDGVDSQVLSFIFEIKMLSTAGIEPVLDRCVHCGRQEGHFGFSIQQGGLLCQHCMYLDSRLIPITSASIRLLRLFKGLNLARLGQISLKNDTRNELKQLITLFYDQYSGLQLKSRRFLDQMEHWNKT